MKNKKHSEKVEKNDFQEFCRIVDLEDSKLMEKVNSFKEKLDDELINQFRKYMTKDLTDKYIAWQFDKKNGKESKILEDIEERAETFKNNFSKEVTSLKVEVSLIAKEYLENEVSKHDHQNQKPDIIH